MHTPLDLDYANNENTNQILKSDTEMMEPAVVVNILLKNNKHISSNLNDSNNNTKLEEFDDSNQSATILVLNNNDNSSNQGINSRSRSNSQVPTANNDHNEEDHLQLSRLLSSNNNDGSDLQHDNNTPNDTDEVSLLFFSNWLDDADWLHLFIWIQGVWWCGWI